MLDRFLGGKPLTRENAIAAFNAHNQRVKDIIPSDKYVLCLSFPL
jgi:hypothetical protein